VKEERAPKPITEDSNPVAIHVNKFDTPIPKAEIIRRAPPLTKKILVTGGSRGVGYIICQQLLATCSDVYVILSARNSDKGLAAVAKLIATNAAWRPRVEFQLLDVLDEISAQATAKKIEVNHGSLSGIVNAANLGGVNCKDEDIIEIKFLLAVNFFGAILVTEVFAPLLNKTGGYIVNVSHTAGPTYISTCSPGMQRQLCNPSITPSELNSVAANLAALDRKVGPRGMHGTDKRSAGQIVGPRASAFLNAGLGDDGFGASKALLNSYTLLSAAAYPQHKVNSCFVSSTCEMVSPVFLATSVSTSGGFYDSAKNPSALNA